MSLDELDYETILKTCGIECGNVSTIITKLTKLKETYNTSSLVNIYNYCLVNINSPEILIPIIKLVTEYKSTKTLSILLSFLQIKNTQNTDDSFINLRVSCIKAISTFKDNSSVEILLNCLNNKNEHYKVRLACADALGRIGNTYAVKPLINLVEDENEKSIYLKESATFALGILGDSSAIEPLVSILESKQGLWDKFSFLKEKIVEALGKLNLKNDRVMKALKTSLMDSSPMVRINSIEAIMNSEHPDSIKLIKPCLYDDEDEVKQNALIALYNLTGRDILDEVINLPSYNTFLKNLAQELINEYEDCNE